MQNFRKKPVIVQAVQFLDPASVEELKGELTVTMQNSMWFAKIKTLEGTMTANEGDWIIRGTKGELYPCKPNIFEQVYEAV